MSENSYEIYQLKNNEAGHDLRFMNTDYLKKRGQKVNRENYDPIYNAPLDTGETLDSIYEKFNLYRPADFRGHSLSVSDVIVFHKDGRDNAYFVDSFGFTEVPEFLQVQVMENTITMASDKITVNQHIGTWYPIDMQEIDGRTYFLLEHETYGSDVAGVIVDEKGALYAQEIFDGFTPEVIEQIRLAAASVEVMPDPNVSVDDMVAYGYSYRGMLPLNADAAKAHWEEAKLMLYALHPDGTESLIDNEKQFERHIECQITDINGVAKNIPDTSVIPRISGPVKFLTLFHDCFIGKRSEYLHRVQPFGYPSGCYIHEIPTENQRN